MFLVHQTSGSPIPQAEALEQAALRARLTNSRWRHVPQSVASLVVRAGPGVVRVVNRERYTLNNHLLASRIVFGLISLLSLVTPDPCHALPGGSLIVRTPKSRDGRNCMGRSIGRAETTPKSGQLSLLQCIWEVGRKNREVVVGVV